MRTGTPSGAAPGVKNGGSTRWLVATAGAGSQRLFLASSAFTASVTLCVSGPDRR